MKEDFVVTRSTIIQEAVYRCFKEMYLHAQPSADFDELSRLAKEGKEDKDTPFYQQHYLSEEEVKCIVNKYVNAYNLHNEFKEHCDTILGYFDDGIIDKYIERNGDEPGYRGYENLKPLKEIINNDEAYDEVVKRINQAKDFYRFNREEENFRFSVYLGCSPTSNKQTVIDYWKSKGVDIEIKDRDDDEIFERHYYGITDFDDNEEDTYYDDGEYEAD